MQAFNAVMLRTMAAAAKWVQTLCVLSVEIQISCIMIGIVRNAYVTLMP